MDEVRLHQGLAARGEDVGVGDRPGAEQPVDDGDLAAGALEAGPAHGTEVRAQRRVVPRHLEAQQVDLGALQVGVHLDADGERQTQPPRLVEHGAALPGIGAERIVIGDREVGDAAGGGGAEELDRRQVAVADEGVEVKVQQHGRPL